MAEDLIFFARSFPCPFGLPLTTETTADKEAGEVSIKTLDRITHSSKRRVKEISEDIEEEVGAEGKPKSCFCRYTKLTAVDVLGRKAVFILNQQEAIRRSCPDVEIDITANIDLIFDT